MSIQLSRFWGTFAIRNRPRSQAHRLKFIKEYDIGRFLSGTAEYTESELEREVKRFLTLVVLTSSGRTLGLFSNSVRRVWTAMAEEPFAYGQFCGIAAGWKMSPRAEQFDGTGAAQYSEFSKLYQETFGELPPKNIWGEAECEEPASHLQVHSYEVG